MCATMPCFYMSAGESKLQSSWRTVQEVLYLVSHLPSPVLAFYLTRLLGCWHKYTAQCTLPCILAFSLRSHGNIGLLDLYHSLRIVSRILDFLSS